MPLDAIDTAIEEWEAGNRDLKTGALAIMKFQLDEIVRLTAALDECRHLLAQAFGRPAARPAADVPAVIAEPAPAAATIAAVDLPKKRQRRKLVMKPCGRCNETKEISSTAKYCKPCFGILAGERSSAFYKHMRELRAAEATSATAPLALAAVS